MLEIRNLVKVYKTKGGQEVRALDNVSVKFPETGMIFLLGKSGSGKSTLLNVSGGLDKPDSGEIIIKGKNSKDFSGADFDSYRNTYIGFIFQEYNILNEFNIEQNIELALQLQGKKNDKAAVDALLEQVDLKGLAKRKPNTLSGGQKQRVAIARALIKSPEIIMADEPTGALDSNTGKQVFDTLKKLSKEKLVIVVSHDRDFAEIYADRIIELADGKIISDVTKAHIEPKMVNENINLINDNVLSIKDVKSLKKEDMDKIYEVLKNQDGEVLITSNDRNLKSVKQAIHISEDNKSEVFNDTKEVSVKEYDGKKTKFIKSHLPFSRAFKIGASSIKSKPGRMILTVLLTIVALVMFGVASTLMLYNPTYSVSEALKESPNDYEQIIKKYKFNYVYHNYNLETKEDKIDKDTRYNQTYFTDSEIAKLNNESSNLNYAGVITFNSYNDVLNFADLNTNGGYYAYSTLYGLIDSGADYINKIGNIVTGRYPTEVDEIMISEFMYETFKKDSNMHISNYDDLIYDAIEDNTITINLSSNNRRINNLKFKVVGIFNPGSIPSMFDELKNDNPTLSQKELNTLKTKYENYIRNSYNLLGFVSEDFYDYYVDELMPNDNNSYNSYINGISLKGLALNQYYIEYNVDSNNYQYVLTTNLVDITRTLNYYDLDGNKAAYVDLKDNQVYLSYRRYQEIEETKERNRIELARLVISHYGISDYTYELFKDNKKEEEYYRYIDQYYNRSITKENKEKLLYLVDNYSDIVGKLNYLLNSANNYMEQYGIEGKDKEDSAFASFRSKYEELSGYFYNNDELHNNQTKIGELLTYLDNYLKNNKVLDHYFLYFAAMQASYKSSLSQSDADTLKNFIDNRSALTEADYVTIKNILDNNSIKYGFYDINSYYTNNEDYTTIYYKNYKGKSGTLEVVGYFKMEGAETPYFLVTEDFVNANATIDSTMIYYGVIESDYEVPTETKYQRLITKTTFSQDEVKKLLADYGDYKYEMTNQLYVTLEQIIDLISTLKTVFLIVGISFGVFAALMLFNFISSSINSKIREIGILRAVGARGSDLFKIFFSESGLISLICTVLSIIAAFFVCMYMNNSLTENLGFKVLNFGILNIGIIIVGALLIAVIGTFIPVLRASKRQPVDSIRTL